MDSSDWSSGIRYHTFDTRPDTEFKKLRGKSRETCVTNFGGPIPREGTETGRPGVGHKFGVPNLHTQTPSFLK